MTPEEAKRPALTEKEKQDIRLNWALTALNQLIDAAIQVNENYGSHDDINDSLTQLALTTLSAIGAKDSIEKL